MQIRKTENSHLQVKISFSFFETFYGFIFTTMEYIGIFQKIEHHIVLHPKINRFFFFLILPRKDIRNPLHV